MVTYLIFAFFMSLLQGVIGIVEIYSNKLMETSELKQVLLNDFQSATDDVALLPFVIIRSTSSYTVLYAVNAVIIVVPSYIANVWYGWQVYKTLKASRNIMSARTLNIQKQITNVLVIQVRELVTVKSIEGITLLQHSMYFRPQRHFLLSLFQ